MSYSKTTWQDLPNTSTPINKTRLNNMENGIADANGAIAVNTYSNTSTYAIGDYCMYNNKLYRCKTTISTAENFNNTKWQEIKIMEEIANTGTTVSSTEPTGNNKNKIWFKKGKNLFDIAAMLKSRGISLPYTTEKNGITFTFQRDGGIKVQGTASSNVQYYVFGSYNNTTEIDFPIDLKNGIKYTSSGGASDWSSGCQFVMYDYDGTNRRSIEFKNTSLTMNKDGYNPTAFLCNIQSGTTVDTIYYLQIEVGSTATNYEAPIEPEIYTKNNGEVYEKFVQKNSKLLWKNANPTNDFAPQAITLNTDDYENLEIYYKQGENSSMVMSSKTLKGYGTRLSLSSVNSSFTGGATYQRTANYINDTTYNIGNCSVQQGNNVATDNSAIIPILILGYK